jgi:hypothetical protein
MRVRIAAIAASVAIGIGTGMLVTPDVFPTLHTYGVSVGTNNHYCSAELVNWHPGVSCQTAN